MAKSQDLLAWDSACAPSHAQASLTLRLSNTSHPAASLQGPGP